MRLLYADVCGPFSCCCDKCTCVSVTLVLCDICTLFVLWHMYTACTVWHMYTVCIRTLNNSVVSYLMSYFVYLIHRSISCDVIPPLVIRDGFSPHFGVSFKLFETFMTVPSVRRPFYAEPCLHTFWIDVAVSNQAVGTSKQTYWQTFCYKETYKCITIHTNVHVHM